MDELVKVAVPWADNAVLPREVAPSRKFTVPVGVPVAVEVTVAVKVTVCPDAAGSGATVNAVVVVAPSLVAAAQAFAFRSTVRLLPIALPLGAPVSSSGKPSPF